MHKKEKVIYIASSIILMILVIVGVTYAYFSANVIGGEDDTTMTITATNGLLLIFTDGEDVVNADDIAPGWQATKTFNIKNPGNAAASYDLYFNDVINTFVNKNDLVYTITSTNGGGTKTQTTLPSADEQVISGISIPANTTQVYTLTIKYLNTESNQIADVGKKFSFKIFIEENKTILKNVILASDSGITELQLSSFNKTAQNTGNEDATNTLLENGIYKVADDYGISYYYRGAIDNNWVEFAGFYWRIIRIDGKGNIRMIYNGIANGSPQPTGETTQISETHKFNASSNDNAYVGFKYGTAGASTGTDLEKYQAAHSQENPSNAYTQLTNWYNSNIANQGNNIIDKIVTNAVYCGDRNMSPIGSPVGNTALGYATNATNYATYYRLLTNKTPILTCQNTVGSGIPANNDQYITPVGLITADEISFAGGRYTTSNTSYWLYTNEIYWTMSPLLYSTGGTGAFVFNVNAQGSLNTNPVSYVSGLRPVLALNSEVVISSGDGSANTPYVID